MRVGRAVHTRLSLERDRSNNMGSAMHALVVLLFIAAVVTCRSIDERSGRPCAFGDRMLMDCEVARRVPEKCMTTVCRDGEIVEEMVGGPMDTGCCLGFDSVLYSNGYKTEHCVPVTCNNSVWVPVQQFPECCAPCRLYAYSHFTTFDGHHYDWQGNCNYTLVQQYHPVEGQGAVVSVEMESRGSCASTFAYVTFRNDPGSIVNLTTVSTAETVDVTMDMNGEMMNVPDAGVQHFYSYTTGNITMMAFRLDNCQVVLGSSLLTLVYCPLSFTIFAPRALSGSLSGLCGAFNYDVMDDFTTPAGEVLPLEMYPVYFPDMWRAETQIMPMCMQDGVDTSLCNGKQGNKCQASAAALEQYRTTCQDALQDFISRKPELFYYVASCVTDLCLAEQGDLGNTTSLTSDPILAATSVTDLVQVILSNYRTITGRHFMYLESLPLFSDLSNCTGHSNTTSIPVVDDSTVPHGSHDHDQ